MPVRSRGSLLAGTAALAGLIVAGLGCHSSYSDHDAFSIPNTAPQSGNFLSSSGLSGLLPSRGETAMQAGYPAQSIVGNAPAPMSAPVSRPVMLQSVPVTQPMTNLPLVQPATNQREVIASSWSPVQRVSAEQPAAGPDLQGGAITVTGNTPAIPARLPIGTPMANGNGPALEGGEGAPPGNIMLPPPRPLGSGNGPMVVMDGAGPPPLPPHPHDNVPREFEKMALPPYVVEPPDILLIQASHRITLRLQPIQGQHLVGPDGTINLGIYGKIRVAGLTLDQVADAVASRLLEIMPGLLRGVPEVDDKGMEKKGTEGSLLKEFRQDFTSLDLIKRELQVDVLVYSSKFYYVITDGGGYGQQVYPIPIRGNETVLDALANINGLPAVANKKRVWVARATRAGQPPKILPVDWMAVTKCGKSDTNYQLFPGDRVYVDSSNLIKADTLLSKLYSPIQRTFGVILLGGAMVNTLKGTSSGLGAGAGLIR